MLSYWFINKSQLLHQVGLTNHFEQLLFSKAAMLNNYLVQYEKFLQILMSL